MLPDPLHPAVVHFPIVLAVLMPLTALGVLIAVARGLVPGRAWAGVLLLQALLVGSTWIALETGEKEEERVEHVVAERHIEAHEEAGERFLLVAGLGLVALAGGLLPGLAGTVGRFAGAAVTLAVLAAGVAVGHSGGELVYEHGAASAYVAADVTGLEAGSRAAYGDDREDSDSD